MNKTPHKQRVRQVLDGLRQGRPLTGPMQVHLDITNGCNAACVTCWDHSPLLTTPRSADWKRRRLPFARFEQILAMLDELHAAGITIVLVTHEADVAARAKRVVLVRDGKIVADGPPARVEAG